MDLSSVSAAEQATHRQACSDLQAGRPLQALRAWRQLLSAEPERIRTHLKHGALQLQGNPIAPVKQLALDLFESLLQGEPGETEQGQLGREHADAEAHLGRVHYDVSHRSGRRQSGH